MSTICWSPFGTRPLRWTRRSAGGSSHSLNGAPLRRAPDLGAERRAGILSLYRGHSSSGQSRAVWITRRMETTSRLPF